MAYSCSKISVLEGELEFRSLGPQGRVLGETICAKCFARNAQFAPAKHGPSNLEGCSGKLGGGGGFKEVLSRVLFLLTSTNLDDAAVLEVENLRSAMAKVSSDLTEAPSF